MLKGIIQKTSKTAAAYLVAGIALIQLAPVFFNTFPPEDLFGISEESLMQIIFILVGIGFPVSIFLAYFFVTPKGDSSSNLKEQKTASGDYKQKIAVIPFTNLNKDEDGAFLVDGIVEDLITEFSMISEIEIVSRQTCFNLRDENLSHQEYREKYELDYIVSGSIRAVDDRLRISVELSELNDGNVLWGCKYDRVKEDIFDIQDEIVRKITISLIGEIELSSLERAKRKPTENMTSYESLLKGKEHHQRFTKEDNEESLRALDLSIQADRNNSQAYAWKACALGQAYGRGYRDDTDQLISEIMENINKAVELNNNDFEAHRMLAEVHLSLHEFDKAYNHGFKSFQLNPNDPRVTSVFGEILIRIDKLDKGVELLEKAYELDPIPQGQNTSDRRLCALLTGYYLKNDFNKCRDLINDISDIDFKSWLLSTNIHKKNNFNIDNLNWFVSGSKKFANIDIELEIDRFHLNNKELSKTLVNEAKEILN